MDLFDFFVIFDTKFKLCIMAISKHTLDLIKLALEDRELTFKERQVIVDAAVKEGASVAEINAVLDNMVALRLRSYSKEQLKRCPSCGAQIPLISDDCFYCGAQLEKTAQTSTFAPSSYNISGEEAEIIRSENRRVEQEEFNITNCPDCGAPFPLMSNVCTHCGHVLHARQESEFNVKRLIAHINASSRKLLNSEPVTFKKVFDANMPKVKAMLLLMCYVSMPLYMDAVASYSGALAGLMWAIVLVLGAFVIVVMKIAINTKTGNADDVASFSAQLDFNKYTRYVDAFYGDNEEARRYLSKFAGVIRKVKTRNMLQHVKFAAFTVVVLLLPFVPHWLPYPSASWFVNNYLEEGFSLFK